MVLQTCPDCSHRVSDKAPACPGCGRPRTARGFVAEETPAVPGGSPTVDRERSPTAETHPWHRYWARMVDSMLFSAVGGFVLAFIAPGLLYGDSGYLLTALLLFGWVFVEAALLAAWGTTPGKALLRIRLRTADDSDLSFQTALARSFDVWVRGMGIGIPLITLITMIYSYTQLQKNGATRWDRSCDTEVVHAPISGGRWAAIVVILLAFFALAVLGTAA